MFPAPLMSAMQELGAFLSRETAAANGQLTDLPAHPNGAPASV